MDLTKLKSREFLGQFLNDNGLVGVGVEVGVLSGGNARQIMSQWQGQMLHLIDPWERVDPAIYKERQEWLVEDCYKECQKLAMDYPGRITLHKAYSPQAAEPFPDGFLDWVYLDGNHSYEAVMADVKAWWPKVKPGGLFGGHDYRSDTVWPQFCQVKEAVDEWRGDCPVHHTNVRISQDPFWCGSWWFTKPSL